MLTLIATFQFFVCFVVHFFNAWNYVCSPTASLTHSFLESMLMVDLRFAAVVVDNDMVCWSQERMCVCGTQFIFSLGS